MIYDPEQEKKKFIEKCMLSNPVPLNIIFKAWGSDDPDLANDHIRNSFMAVYALINREYAEAMWDELNKDDING